MMGLYATVMEQITWYTGLSPTAFFTIAALSVLVYKTVCSMFVDPEDFRNLPPVVNANFKLSLLNSNHSRAKAKSPVRVGEISDQELRVYDGSDPNRPILMAIKGHIYDVSSSRMFYGPGGQYAMFAGRDASRALALVSSKPQDLDGNLEGLDDSELEILQDWEDKFAERYVKVGQLVPRSTRTLQSESCGNKIFENQNEEENGKAQ